MAILISRRAALSAGAGVLALGLSRSSFAGAIATNASELFVFKSPDARNLVFAVLTPTIPGAAPSSRHSKRDVYIHTGAASWAVREAQAGALSKHGGSRIFAGQVLAHSAPTGRGYSAVVVESSPDFARPGETLAVWAEVKPDDGKRFRVGSPFVSELLARDPVLSLAYHAATPVQDRALFAGSLAKRIAAMAAASGTVANPGEHAQRIATRLLPDVIEFRPDSPVGFNFASQNGRHPADDTASVVATVLTGAPARQDRSTPFKLTETFPYFRRDGIAA